MEKIAQNFIEKALKSVDPYQLIHDQVKVSNGILTIAGKEDSINLSDFRNIYCIGAGKGTAPMAAAMEELLGDYLKAGVITVKYGHGLPMQKINVLEAGHPIPDENTLTHTREMLRLAEQAGEDDLVIVLLSGGGSALMEALPESIPLQKWADLNQSLLASGADITQINTIRKHLSLTKGGRLAQRIAPAQTLTLILSDVIGDPLNSIASGPTAPDPSTFQDALEIIKRYQLENDVAPAILAYLQAGCSGQIEENPRDGDPLFKRVRNYIIGNNALALNKLEQLACEQGFKTLRLTDRVQGEAREIAKVLAAIVQSALYSGFPVTSPACLILGGEPTVTLQGKGKGGRNQELTLAMLQALQNVEKNFYFSSLGSDGTDGPTDAAGAWIDQRTMAKVKKAGLSIADYLNRNDSYHFFKAIDQLIITGPTRTNVMDIMFCLI